MDRESAPAGSGAHDRLLLRFRILDTDENGYLDETDFDRLAGYVASVAALVDRDDDGYVERDDFITCMTASGFPKAGGAAVFEELDESGSGRIAVGHWAAAIVDWYRSERTDVPGHILVTPTSDD